MIVQRAMTRAVKVGLLGVALFGTAACGFVLTQGPPRGYEHLNAFSCTTSNTGPILDAVEAGGGVIFAIVGAADPNRQAAYAPSGSGLVAMGVGGGLIYGASAVAGFHKTSACRVALRQLAARQARGRAGAADHPVASPDRSLGPPRTIR